ncbi:TlpA family protein disulfide reductase [Mucilaginibacter calamicampi]|uniref:TlpA family protein disulfide reductase n=1 Tax=Mucilaginibacter calamicampi TaxID=1302352 RepID=A0ABW2YWY6_9SPHI
MKKAFLYFLFCCYVINNANAQAGKAPEAWLAMTNKLASLKSIAYTYKHETNNIKDNSYDTLMATCYLDFNYDDEQTISKFRIESDKIISIFNGTELFTLNKASKTYSLTEQASQRLFSNRSLFQNSLQTLRNAANQITANDGIIKTQRDTVINNKTYKLVQMDMFKKTLSYAVDLMQFTKDVTVYYKVIIDPATWLPYQVLNSNSLSKEGYNTKTVFSDINTNPVKPDEYSWYYSTYQNEYKPEKKEARSPLIAAGSKMPLDWSLPEYTQKANPVFKGDGLKGKLILFDFWIMNCGHCIESLPVLKELQAKYGGDKFQLISINAYDKKQEIDAFYKRERPQYKILYNGSAFAKSLGVFGYPTFILMDGTGKVLLSSERINHPMIEPLIKANL